MAAYMLQAVPKNIFATLRCSLLFCPKKGSELPGEKALSDIK
jgi:hypothetical protein